MHFYFFLLWFFLATSSLLHCCSDRPPSRSHSYTQTSLWRTHNTEYRTVTFSGGTTTSAEDKLPNNERKWNKTRHWRESLENKTPLDISGFSIASSPPPLYASLALVFRFLTSLPLSFLEFVEHFALCVTEVLTVTQPEIVPAPHQTQLC